MKNILSTITLLCIPLLLASCAPEVKDKETAPLDINVQQVDPITGDVAPEETEQPVDEPTVGMANPASVNCVEKGGTLEMRENKKGVYGVCIFEDNRQCEEWALFRGQCPEGGVKITGYDSEAEIYCAITDGQVEFVDEETPLCKRTDGTLCNAQSNLDGDCPDPNDPNPSAGNMDMP